MDAIESRTSKRDIVKKMIDMIMKKFFTDVEENEIRHVPIV